MITPNEIDDEVKKLISKVCPTSKAIYLTIETENYAQVNECLIAVAEKIRRDGGSQVLGWQIWKSNIIIEAEFHAIWKSPQGELKDITPKIFPVQKILFLTDPGIKYDGTQIDNVRINISGNRLGDDYIEIAQAIYRFQNKGERAFQYGEIRFTDKEEEIFRALEAMKDALYNMIQNGQNRNSVCFCNRGIKYKYCHGKNLVEILGRL